MLLAIFHVNLSQWVTKVKFASLLSKIFLLATPYPFTKDLTFSANRNEGLLRSIHTDKLRTMTLYTRVIMRKLYYLYFIL